jgi:hypothetical protein
MKKIFNPFADVGLSPRGAPMGRMDNDKDDDGKCTWDGKEPLLVMGQGDNQPAYDNGGAYWGTPNDVYAVFTRDGSFCVYRRAKSTIRAVRGVKEEYANAPR